MKRLYAASIQLIGHVGAFLAMPLLGRAREKVRTSPKSATAHAALGKAYQMAGQPIKGIAQFRTSLCINGNRWAEHPQRSPKSRSTGLPVRSLQNLEIDLRSIEEQRR